MNSLVERYQPRWLYLHEFALALAPPDTDEADIKDAVALLIRDRLIVDGRLNEAEFRFLEGQPDLRTTAWVNKLTSDDFNWALSEMLAGVDTSKPRSRISDTFGLLIEIASSALNYFGETKLGKRKAGTPELYDWIEIKSYFFKLLEKKGDPTNPLNHVEGWKSMTDAMKAVTDYLQGRDEKVPEKTQLRDKLNLYLADWSTSKSAN